MLKLKRLTIVSLIALIVLSSVITLSVVGLKKVRAEWETTEEAVKLSYSLGENLTIPEYTLTIKGNSVKTTYSLELPDGNYIKGKNHLLSSTGLYTIHYYSEYENKSYSKDIVFEVKNSAYKFTSSKSEAVYGRYDRNLCDSEGLIVRLASNDRMDFAQVLDIQDFISTNTIIEGFITPDNMGSADFNKFIVRLTDSVDSENYVDIEYNRSQYGTISGSSFVGVAAGARGQDMIGLEINANSFKVHKNDNFGALITHSFIAKTNANGGWSTPLVDFKNDARLLTLSFDHDQATVYAQGSYVTKLNDANYYEKLWNGFDSGKVRLSIRAEGYLSSTANFCLTKVMGLSIEELSANSYSSGIGPVITINTDYETMPQAEKNVAYKIPEASAFDYEFGECNVITKVYYNYASIPVSVSVINGTFTPERLGKYAIEYTSINPTGCETVKILLVDSVSKVEELKVSNPQNRTIIEECGREIEIKDPIVTGGSGKSDIKITAELRNKKIDIIGNKFIPQEAGDWTITYEATDYLGRVATECYMINVKPGTTPIFDGNTFLPLTYISNSKYIIPTQYVLDYSTGKLVKETCDCVITDANGTKTYKAGEEFTPKANSNGEMLSLKFVSGETSTETFEIPMIIALEPGTVYQDRYFIGSDIETSTEGIKNGILISFNKETNGKWFFANSMLSGNCSIKIGATEDGVDFKEYEVKFINAVNGKTVTATLTQANAVTAILKVMNESIELSYTLSSTDPFTITYADNRVIFSTDSMRTSVPVKTYDDGSEFDDFSNGAKCYLEVSSNEIKFDSKYIVYAVSGMNLSYRNKDNIAPNINILGTTSGSYSYGELYRVPMANAGDTCAPNVEISLTATDSDGNIISDINGLLLENVACDKEYIVKLNEYGVISFTYTANEIDWIGNTKTFVNAITVIDEVSPEIKFLNKTKDTAKVGDVIVMPDFEVSDNITEKADIKVVKYVINGEGKFISLEGNSNSIKTEYKGKYTFVVMAYDEFGNSSSAYYEVYVTE